MTIKEALERENTGGTEFPHAAEASPLARSSTDLPINILLVDDEPKNLTVLQTILDDRGYRLVLAESADQALLALVVEEFALIVLDIHMPGMNGFELAHMIKQRKKTANVPIIFLTAYYSEDEHVLEGYGSGAVDYLHKPVNPVVLRSKVAVFAELYRKTRESARINRALMAEVAERKRIHEQLIKLNNELERRVDDRTSELHRASSAVRESEQRLELALKGADLGVWDWNVLTGSIQFDARWTQMLGFTIAEIPHHYQFWEERIHPDDHAGVVAGFQDHLAGRSPDFRVQHRLRHKDGRWIWVIARGRVVARDPAGHALRACGTLLDITALKKTEDALRRSEAFARSVIESSADCVQVFSLDGKLQWMNENARRLMEECGKGAGENCDWPLFWEAGGVKAEAEAALSAARTSGIGRFRGFSPTPAGPSRCWDVAVTVISDPDGTPEQFLAVSRDVTEQREAEESLKEAYRRKDEFLAMLSHELRNPMAPIRNAVEILRLIGLTDPALAASLDMIERQVTHMVRLVDDLLDVSRVSRGKIQLQKKPIDLAAVVQQAVETSRQLIESRGHQLTVTLPEEPVCVVGDFTRMAQVVLNLIDNAAKYTDKGGKIWLTVEKHDERAIIRVRDTGRGIEPSALTSLFDLFYQADRNLDRSEGGLGIGLSLVKSLVHMHDGTVEAHSAGRGKGSEFVVCLPCMSAAPVERPHEMEKVPVTTSRGSGGIRILVVDDLRDSADSMALLLKLEGHEVFTAHDGKQAVEIALRERPDAVLLDIGLPEMNGYEACKVMREAGLTETLIVAMTGYGQEQDRRQSQEAGFDAHLIKPLDVVAIRELLAKRAGQSQATT